MGRATHNAVFSANGLFSILFLVMVVGGLPIVVKQARDAGHALSALVW